MTDPTAPPPLTPPGRWLDRVTGSPAVRLTCGVILGVILSAAAQWLWPKVGLPGDPPAVGPIPLEKGEPKVIPAPVRVQQERVRAYGERVRIPRGEIPDTLVSFLPETAPAPRDGPPLYRVPPGELVPHAMEFCGRGLAERRDWGLAAVGAPAAWQTTRGAGVRVAVLDTGIDSTHPDLRDAIAGAKDFTGSASGPADVQGHGSHVAGVVAARVNGSGVVGVAPECSLLAGKVLGDDGSGSTTGIAAGIDWAVGQKADVISLSLGGPSDTPDIRSAAKRAVSAGVIVVAAAGNDGPKGSIGYPGALPEVVCVAAVDSGSKVADFSSRGAAVLVAAPGVNVLSCYPGSRLATMSGTSMATPHVAGLAALWCAADRGDRSTRPARFRAAIQAAAKDIPPPGRDPQTGFGLPDAAKLVAGPANPPAGQPNQVYVDFDSKVIVAPRGWQLVTPKE